MVLYLAKTAEAGASMSDEELQQHLLSVLKDKFGSREKVCIVPPDYTRFHSNAGILTQATYQVPCVRRCVRMCV